MNLPNGFVRMTAQYSRRYSPSSFSCVDGLDLWFTARWDERDSRHALGDLLLTFDRITLDPAKMGGQACGRGLRIPVATVVRCVASGMSSKDILEAYPDLEPEDIAGALQYAASLTEDRIIPLSQTGS